MGEPKDWSEKVQKKVPQFGEKVKWSGAPFPDQTTGFKEER